MFKFKVIVMYGKNESLNTKLILSNSRYYLIIKNRNKKRLSLQTT
jgi:hypothetical protein